MAYIYDLPSINSLEMANDDLFVVHDSSAITAKKITADELKKFVYNFGVITASLFGTSSFSSVSLTSSYLKYIGVPNGTASYAINSSTSSYSINSLFSATASNASVSISSSYSLSSSYCKNSETASYSLIAGSTLADTSSYSSFALTSSYLLYPGTGSSNGTASYAIISGLASNSNTSSYIYYNNNDNGTVFKAITSSYSLTSSFAFTSSFLLYNGIPNGTASYAISSSRSTLSSFVKRITPYGIFLPSVTSISESRMNSMNFYSSVGDTSFNTLFTVVGDCILNYTQSLFESGNVELIIKDESISLSETIDEFKVSYILKPVSANLFSGSVQIPFTLMGYKYTSPNRYYTLFITSSTDKVTFDTNRPMKIQVSTTATDFSYSNI